MDPKEVAANLEVVMEQIQSGELTATDAQRGFIAGAIETLKSLESEK